MTQDVFKNMAVTDKYQPYAGGLGKMKVPCGIPKISSIKMSLCKSTPLRIFETVIAAMINSAPTILRLANTGRK